MYKIRNKGFSLLEILLVLAIAAAVVIAAFIIYPKVTAEKTADSESKRVMMIAAAARSLYASKANYSGLTFDVLKNADLIDKGMFAKMDGGMPISEFGTPMTLYAANGNTMVAVEYQQLKKENCIRLVPKIGGGAHIIQINGIPVLSPTVQLNMGDVTTQCSAGIFNTVSFYFN